MPCGSCDSRAVTPIEVRTKSSYFTRIGIVMAMFLLPATCGIIAGIRAVIAGTSNGLPIVGVAALFGAVALVFPIGRRSWVRYIDDRGVTTRSGRLYPWHEFQAITEQRMRGRYGTSPAVNNYLLVFRSGKAGLFHQMAENDMEVMGAVLSLQRGGPAALLGVPPQAQQASPVAPSGPAPGAHVRAQGPDGNWYPAVVQQTSGGQYLVAFPNGQQLWLPVDRLAPPS